MVQLTENNDHFYKVISLFDRYVKFFLDDKEMRLKYEEVKQRAETTPGFGELLDLESYRFDANPILQSQSFIKSSGQLQKS